jgi:hypothetical protein
MIGAASELPHTVQNRAWFSWRLPHWEQNMLASLESDAQIAASDGSDRGPVLGHKHQTPLCPDNYGQNHLGRWPTRTGKVATNRSNDQPMSWGLNWEGTLLQERLGDAGLTAEIPGHTGLASVSGYTKSTERRRGEARRTLEKGGL